MARFLENHFTVKSLLKFTLPTMAMMVFTSLNNGLISALIAFLRTLVFECGAVLILPLIWGIDGIWLSVSIAELCAAIIAVTFMIALRNRYGYSKKSLTLHKNTEAAS